MTDVLTALSADAFVDFIRLFPVQEGRRGITVTFIAILELLREGLIEIVQAEAYAPLHVRLGNPARHLTLVAAADAANEEIARPE
jgi:segregation and condensation protein A